MIYVGQCAVDYVGYAVRHLFQRVAEHKYSAIGKAHGGNHLLNESHFSSWESVRANSIAYYLKCFTSRNSNLFWISRRSRYVYRGRAKASPQTYHRRPAALFTNVESAGAGRLGANCGNILGIPLFFLLEWMVCEQTVKLEFKVRGDVSWVMWISCEQHRTSEIRCTCQLGLQRSLVQAKINVESRTNLHCKQARKRRKIFGKIQVICKVYNTRNLTLLFFSQVYLALEVEISAEKHAESHSFKLGKHCTDT